MSRRWSLAGGWHVHLCPCGTEWLCNKPDCRNDEDCTACEDAQQAAYWESRGYTAQQPALPGVEVKS